MHNNLVKLRPATPLPRAEVLSADAFSAFEEVGLENTEAVAKKGRAFRDTVLSLGGGRAPALVFKARVPPALLSPF